MKYYKVKVDCHGFLGRFWKEGLFVQLPDDSNPPKHFERIKKSDVAEQVFFDPYAPRKPLPGQPLSSMMPRPIIRTGMAAGLQVDNIDPRNPKKVVTV